MSNWNHQNVAMWMLNDESLYRTMRYCIRISKTKDQAVLNFQRELAKMGIKRTPNGAPYTKTAIRAAMVGY